MTRIIAGFAGSLQLKGPAVGTRPSSDRVREAIFSALEARGVLHGAHVLDLYAGTGALGLEAVSRGATHAVLVESSFAATVVIRENVAAIKRAARGPAPDIVIVSKPVRRYLGEMTISGRGRPTLVFMDPPYAFADDEVHEDLRMLSSRVARGALVVLERPTRGDAPAWPPGVAFDRSRAYGDTMIHFLTADGPATD